jgi:hypothetical protein
MLESKSISVSRLIISIIVFIVVSAPLYFSPVYSLITSNSEQLAHHFVRQEFSENWSKISQNYSIFNNSTPDVGTLEETLVLTYRGTIKIKNFINVDKETVYGDGVVKPVIMQPDKEVEIGLNQLRWLEIRNKSIFVFLPLIILWLALSYTLIFRKPKD